ncbi:hypothetical protein Droror1_Dr00022718 [Drosera rotundifolia]
MTIAFSIMPTPRTISSSCSELFIGSSIIQLVHADKRAREADDFSMQQKLQISLNYNIYQDEVDRSANILNQNPVSTGLRLSYDDHEQNSCVTSTSGSMTAGSSILFPLGDNLRTELERQKEEFDQYIKLQEERLAKGVRDMKQRHMASFLSTIEKVVSKKFREKDVELENVNRRNRELAKRIKQVATEAQTWHSRAKYNESVVNVLKTNLQQAISQGAADQGKKALVTVRSTMRLPTSTQPTFSVPISSHLDVASPL